MVNLGGQNIKALYLGGVEIKRACVGEREVFASTPVKPSRLPEGYTEVEYIQSGSGQYIDTNYGPNIPIKTVMDVEPLSEEAKTEYYFGSTYRYTISGGVVRYNAYVALKYLQLKNRADIKTANNHHIGAEINDFEANKRITVVLDGPQKLAAFGSDSIAAATNKLSNAGSVFLLANHGTGGFVSTNPTLQPMNAKLYSCQIFYNNVAVRDFIPCVNPSGVAGLYDMVSGAFFGSATATPFTPGPAV